MSNYDYRSADERQADALERIAEALEALVKLTKQTVNGP